MQDNTFYERLREERKRIGLTQADFGDIGGVKKLAQANYENGSRQPTVEYINRLRDNPLIDVDYILGGLRNNNERNLYMAESLILNVITTELEIDELSFYDAEAEAYYKSVADGLTSGSYLADEALSNILEMVSVAIGKSPKVIDFNLLESIILKLEVSIVESGFKIEPVKKAAAITMLYRSFRTTGKVDEQSIKDAINLASN